MASIDPRPAGVTILDDADASTPSPLLYSSNPSWSQESNNDSTWNNNTWHACSGGGCSVRIDFVGTSIEIKSDGAPNHGRFYCALDGSYPWSWWNGTATDGNITTNRTMCKLEGLPANGQRRTLIYGTAVVHTALIDFDYAIITNDLNAAPVSPNGTTPALQWSSFFPVTAPAPQLADTTQLPSSAVPSSTSSSSAPATTTSAGSTNPGSSSSSSHGPRVGPIVGIVIGIVALLLIGVGIFLWRRRSKKNKQRGNTASMGAAAAGGSGGAAKPGSMEDAEKGEEQTGLMPLPLEEGGHLPSPRQQQAIPPLLSQQPSFERLDLQGWQPVNQQQQAHAILPPSQGAQEIEDLRAGTPFERAQEMERQRKLKARLYSGLEDPTTFSER